MITRTYNFGRGPTEGKSVDTLYHNVTETIEDLTVTWPNYVVPSNSLGWQGVVGTGGDSDDPQVMLFNRPIKSASILFNEVNYYGNIMVAYDEDDVEIGRCTLDLTWFNDHGEFRAFIEFPTDRIAKILVSGEPSGDWVTWSEMVFVRDVPGELPEFNLDAPKFAFGLDQETIMALRLPATIYLRYLLPAIGGDIDADSGRRAAYRIRQDECISFVLRFFEQEWPLISGWLDEVMNGQQFLFFPISTEDDAFFVTLESPAPGSSYSTQPDSEFPKVLTLAIVLKAVTSFDALNPVPISDAGPDEGPPVDSEPPPDEPGGRDMPAVSGDYLLDWAADLLEENDGDSLVVPSPSERGSSLGMFNGGAGMPTVVRLGTNNIKAIRQTRFDTAIEFPSGSPRGDFIDDFTYYLVCKISAGFPGLGSSGQFYSGASILQGENSGTVADYGLAMFSGGGISVGSGPGDSTSAPGGNMLDGNPHVVTFRRRKSDGLMEGMIDGAVVTSINNSAGVTLNNANPDSPYFYQIAGDYARILGYTARHSDAEVDSIVAALRSYYGF